MRIFFLSCAFALLFAFSAGASSTVFIDQIAAPQPLLPFCSWLPDPEGAQSIDSVAADSLQSAFRQLSGPFPLKGGGPVWLRLEIAKKQPEPARPVSAPTSRLFVTFDDLPPGEARIYMSKAPGQLGGEGSWHAERIFPHEALELPAPGLSPVSVYIRMEETPGLWFAPTLSAENSARPDLLPSAFILPGLFIAACAVCLLRALAERASWALWSSLFLLCALVQTLLPIPGSARSFGPEHLPALLAPGMALILLPHIGRCMFRSSSLPAGQDALLSLCSLLGAAVALGPLVPGFSWLTRLFPLWPLLLLPLLPLCISAMAAKRPGAFAFTGLCCMPLLGAGIALYALFNPAFMHPLSVQASLWGLAVGGLGLVLARIPARGAASDSEDSADATNSVATADAAQPAKSAKSPARAVLALADDPAGQYGESGLAGPEQKPALARQGQYDKLPSLGAASLDWPAASPSGLPVSFESNAELRESSVRFGDPALAGSQPENEGGASGSFYEAREAGEQRVDPLFAAGTGEKTQPLTVQEQSPPEDALPDSVDAAHDQVISLLDNDFSPISMELQELEEESAGQSSFATENGFLFSLHALVREVHSIVAPLAKNRGLVFSWYISPLLPSLLEGDAPRLRGALTLLLQNAVLATRKGSVQLAVRRTPGSSDPGDMLFVINDNGSAQRTEAGFFHAWEMAARTGGVFNVEYSPLSGTQISFTIRFALPSEQMAGDIMGLTEHLHAGFDPNSEGSEDSDEPMPVLSAVLSPAGGDWTAVAASPGGGLAGEGREGEQGALAPLPDLEADEALLAELQGPGGSLATLFPATGSGQTALHRSQAPAEASELPARSGSVLTARPLPELPEKTAAQDISPSGVRRILAAEMTTSARRLLSHYLATVPHEHLQVAVNAQVPDIVRAGPLSLIIFDGDAPEHDIIRALRSLRDEERKNGRAPACVLVLTSHEGQSARLLENGATHALVKPVRQEDVLALALAAPCVEPPAPRPASEESLVDPLADPVGESSLLQPAAPRESSPPEPASPRSDEEVDLLALALRDAPDQQGEPQEVPLPPRYGIAPQQGEARGRAGEAPERLAGEADKESDKVSERREEPQAEREALEGPVAPMLLGLSPEDVRPASPAGVLSEQGEGNPLSLSQRVGPEPEAQAKEGAPRERFAPRAGGSLLDFALPDFSTTKEQAAEQDKSLPASKNGNAPESEQEAKAASGSVPGSIQGAAQEAARDALQRPGPEALHTEKGERVSGAASEAEQKDEGQQLSEVGPAPVQKNEAAPASTPPSEADFRPDSGTRPGHEEKPEPEVEPGSEAWHEAPQGPAPALAPEGRRHAAAKPAPRAVQLGTVQIKPVQSSTEQQDKSAPLSGLGVAPVSGQEDAASSQTFPLPGMDGEALDATVLPLTPGLIHSLNDAMQEIQQAVERGRSIMVQDASGRLAGKAEAFGLTKLGKIARCVERAAEADDMEAVHVLLEDLLPVIKRYMQSLRECFDAFLYLDR